MISTTNRFANYMRSLRPYLEALPKDLKDLAKFALGLHLSVEKLDGDINERDHRLQVFGLSADRHLELLRTSVKSHWFSKSLRLTAPARSFYRSLTGQGPEPTPAARTIEEAMGELYDMHNSISWNLTGPFRAIEIAWRRLKDHFRRGK